MHQSSSVSVFNVDSDVDAVEVEEVEEVEVDVDEDEDEEEEEGVELDREINFWSCNFLSCNCCNTWYNWERDKDGVEEVVEVEVEAVDVDVWILVDNMAIKSSIVRCV